MTESDGARIGGLLLAAGGSSRFGRPKQVVEFEGETLIRRAARALIEAACRPMLVVLGAEVNASAEEIIDLPVHIRVNADWKTGMSSSIKTGLEGLLAIDPGLDAVLITLCDQPRIGSGHLTALMAEFGRSRSPIVATEYEDAAGVPTLFSSEMFGRLLELRGDKGARVLIRDSPDVKTIRCDAAEFDIDTPDDLLK